MKTKKSSQLYIILAVAMMVNLIFWSCSASNKMEKLKPEDVGNMINSKNFTFVAERVNPMRGISKNLTSLYDFKVKRDTLDSYLPYFGRSYQAPIDPSKGGIMFRSNNFSYNVTTKSKDEWEVYIEPNDNLPKQQFIFQVYGNGKAVLNVQNTQRDPITFYGYVKRNND
jgi:hypothetical protein